MTTRLGVLSAQQRGCDAQGLGSTARGCCCYVDARRQRPLLAGQERAGLLDARAKRCAGADRRDDGWAGCSTDGTTRRRGTGRPGRLSRALAMPSEQYIERRRVGEREEEGELTSAASTTTAATGRGLDGGAMARLAAQRVRRARTRRQRRHSDGAGDTESEGEARRSGVGRETRHSGEENCASGEEIVRRAKKSCVWRFQGDEQGAPRVGRVHAGRAGRAGPRPRSWAGGASRAGPPKLGRGASEAGASERWELGRAARGPTRERAGARGGGSWSWAAAVRMGPRGSAGASGPGGEKRGGRGGTAGPAELGQGGSWAEIHFSFSFLFLSLFYLFQFDTMRKQMMR
jgi:hypothetical protein